MEPNQNALAELYRWIQLEVVILEALERDGRPGRSLRDPDLRKPGDSRLKMYETLLRMPDPTDPNVQPSAQDRTENEEAPSPDAIGLDFEHWLLESLKRVLEDQPDLKALVCETLALPPQKRQAFLDQVYNGDEEQLREVIRWVAVYGALTATFGRLRRQLRDFDSFLE